MQAAWWAVWCSCQLHHTGAWLEVGGCIDGLMKEGAQHGGHGAHTHLQRQMWWTEQGWCASACHVQGRAAMPSAGHCPALDALLQWGRTPLIYYLLAAPCLSACQLLSP